MGDPNILFGIRVEKGHNWRFNQKAFKATWSQSYHWGMLYFLILVSNLKAHDILVRLNNILQSCCITPVQFMLLSSIEKLIHTRHMFGYQNGRWWRFKQLYTLRKDLAPFQVGCIAIVNLLLYNNALYLIRCSMEHYLVAQKITLDHLQCCLKLW